MRTHTLTGTQMHARKYNKNKLTITGKFNSKPLLDSHECHISLIAHNQRKQHAQVTFKRITDNYTLEQ